MAQSEYTVEIENSAAKQLSKIEKGQRARIAVAIEALAVNPRPEGCVKLSGLNSYRVRVGDFRIAYLIEDTIRVVTVTNVGHRREIYRRM